MDCLIAILSLAVLIQGGRMRWRTWKSPAYYSTLRANLVIHALIPWIIVGWGLLIHQQPAQQAVDTMVHALQKYGNGMGFLLVMIGWPFAVLHLLSSRHEGIDSGCLVVFGWNVIPIVGFVMFWMGINAAQGESVFITMIILALGFASLGAYQTILAPLVASYNVILLLNALPNWTTNDAVDFLLGAFDLFDVQHQGLLLCLLLISTLLTFADQFPKSR